MAPPHGAGGGRHAEPGFLAGRVGCAAALAQYAFCAVPVREAALLPRIERSFGQPDRRALHAQRE
ncbi:hypothetical protein IP84_14350 [beta proteobacterium AAP99]|nr:hypothetical protein IP84_14350 [beta proteobacterium AAP99]